MENLEDPNFQFRRDTDEYAVCFDAFPKDEIRAKFRAPLHAALVAIGLVLPSRADARTDSVGHVTYLVDPDSGKAIYSFTAEFGAATFSIASPLSEEAMERARSRAQAFPTDGTLAKVADLLIESQETGTNNLRSFIAAWAALEIFVNAMFKAVYEERWWHTTSSNAPVSAKSYFDSLKSVMRDKHRLADKFLVIASFLDSETAESDAATFKRLKSVRDGLFHASEKTARHPVEDTQALLRKYMDLHLDQHNTES